MKAIAIRTLYLVVVIGMIIFFTFLVLSHYMNWQVGKLGEWICRSKAAEYCERKERGETLSAWDEFAKGCRENYEITPSC